MSSRHEMNRQSIWAVVPVKPFAVAKQRLAPVLSDAERIELARLMLDDVLEVLADCRSLAEILVVAADDTARQIASGGGAAVLEDTADDLNASLRAAIEFLRTRRCTGMVVVPSDIPLLPSALVEEMIDRVASPPAVALVSASRDGGTNLLASSPADAIAPSFGPGSFSRHWNLARRASIEPTVLTSDEAGLDIDRPDDLAALLARPPSTRSQAFLATLQIGTRPRDATDGDATHQFAKA